MLPRILEMLHRADRNVSVAFALAFLFGACASALVAHTDKTRLPSYTGPAPLPLQMDVGTPVVTIVHPESLVVHTADLDLSPLLRAVLMQKVVGEERCLAEAMYYEARGEGVEGEKAIAEVVFHRMRARAYPHSLCGVVYQGAGSGHGCQFSFACNGEMQQTKNWSAWARAKRLAVRIVSGVEQLGNETADAISFHAVDVEPGWDEQRLVKTIQIGNHIFYRPAFRSHTS
jgi:Cell Wall Hydrolase